MSKSNIKSSKSIVSDEFSLCISCILPFSFTFICFQCFWLLSSQSEQSSINSFQFFCFICSCFTILPKHYVLRVWYSNDDNLDFLFGELYSVTNDCCLRQKATLHLCCCYVLLLTEVCNDFALTLMRFLSAYFVFEMMLSALFHSPMIVSPFL